MSGFTLNSSLFNTKTFNAKESIIPINLNIDSARAISSSYNTSYDTYRTTLIICSISSELLRRTEVYVLLKGDTTSRVISAEQLNFDSLRFKVYIPPLFLNTSKLTHCSFNSSFDTLSSKVVYSPLSLNTLLKESRSNLLLCDTFKIIALYRNTYIDTLRKVQYIFSDDTLKRATKADAQLDNKLTVAVVLNNNETKDINLNNKEEITFLF